jgi:ABC-type multidrug transport system fused ATPase/permease subunit
MCDRIAVLQGGHLVEQGSHQALLDRGGLYHRLITSYGAGSAS